MAASAVIEPLDVIEDIRLGFLTGLVGLPPYPLSLEQCEEALQRRIVVAMTACTHAALNAVLLQDIAEVIAGVLRPTVGVMQQGTLGLSIAQRHRQRLNGQVPTPLPSQ